MAYLGTNNLLTELSIQRGCFATRKKAEKGIHLIPHPNYSNCSATKQIPTILLVEINCTV